MPSDSFYVRFFMQPNYVLLIWIIALHYISGGTEGVLFIVGRCNRPNEIRKRSFGLEILKEQEVRENLNTNKLSRT